MIGTWVKTGMVKVLELTCGEPPASPDWMMIQVVIRKSAFRRPGMLRISQKLRHN